MEAQTEYNGNAEEEKNLGSGDGPRKKSHQKGSNI